MLHLGALTTTFTPPASCYDLTVSSDSGTFWTTSTFTGADGSASLSSTTTLMTPMWYEKFDYALDPSCYPVADRAMRTEAYYSPGICPEDWTTVERRTRRGETIANCCPSGFTIDTSLCRSSIRVTTTEAILYYQETRASENPQTFTVTANDIVWASGIEVRFKDDDFGSTSRSRFPTTTTTSDTSTSESDEPTDAAVESGPEDTKGDTEAEGAVGGDGTAQDPQPQSNGGGGLSNGAKIGIGIGVPLVAIAAGALAFLLWWRRRRAKAAAADGNLAQQPGYDQGPPGGPQMVMAGAPSQGSPGYDANGYQYAPVAQPVTYGDQAYGAKDPASDAVASLGGYYKTDAHDGDRRASELYAPGAHGRYAQHQRPVGEVQGSSPNQSYSGVSPGGMSPPSGVSPSQSPQQFAAYPAPGQPQGQLQGQYQPYQQQQQYPIHEVGDNQVAPK